MVRVFRRGCETDNAIEHGGDGVHEACDRPGIFPRGEFVDSREDPKKDKEDAKKKCCALRPESSRL